jgi:ABC-type dipeptide/oligopeptide/nickel transport system ATPase subunit
MGEAPVLLVRSLCRQFGGRHGKVALRDVSFELARGRFLAVVGPSGSGKSTLARCIAGFEAPSSGSIRLNGTVQLILQQPAASLNPRFTAFDVVTEPLRIQGCRDRRLLADRAAASLRLVGLLTAALPSRAYRLSGGERQRLAIARALVTEPSLLILDESFAGLDLSVQAQVAALLLDLQKERGLSAILISHDLGFAGRLAGEIAVMDGGAIVEHRPAAELLAGPGHPRTRELLAAAAALSLDGIR